MRKLLKYIKEEYNDPVIYITTCGVADNGTLKDEIRIDFYKHYINNVLKGRSFPTL